MKSLSCSSLWVSSLAAMATLLGQPVIGATIVDSWVDEALNAVKDNPKLGPTVASRTYGILGTVMYDAWSAYEGVPISTQLGDALQRPKHENTLANKEKALSYGAYRVLSQLFPDRIDALNDRMNSLGFDPNEMTSDTTTAAGIGNVMASTLMQFRRNDGSNQLGGYADTSGYTPINSPDKVIDITRWTPEHIPIDDAIAPIQTSLTPHWGEVTPFALESGSEFRPSAPEPFLLVEGATVDLTAKTITKADGTEVEIERSLIGTIINPKFIQQAEDLVTVSANLTDEQKLIAEFWEDGGGTSFPPGHWIEFGQLLSERERYTLDNDVKLFFALGNAVMDTGIASWDTKITYDYTRPVRAIRELGRLGLIGTNDGNGTFLINAWGGVGQGTQLIPATEFLTYQTPGGNPSPPFAEYTSGHSAFSAAGAEILKRFSESDFFGESVTFAPGSSRYELGVTPSVPTNLSWNTFTEAANQAGMSRRYGGIHFESGDLAGRKLGRKVSDKTWDKTQFFISGGQKVPEPGVVFPLLMFASLFLLGSRIKSR